MIPRRVSERHRLRFEQLPEAGKASFIRGFRLEGLRHSVPKRHSGNQMECIVGFACALSQVGIHFSHALRLRFREQLHIGFGPRRTVGLAARSGPDVRGDVRQYVLLVKVECGCFEERDCAIVTENNGRVISSLHKRIQLPFRIWINSPHPIALSSR